MRDRNDGCVAVVRPRRQGIAAGVTSLTASNAPPLQFPSRLAAETAPMARVQVREVRKLMLPLDTAVDAALELDCEQGGALAFGAIVGVKIETDPEPGLLVVVQRRGADATESRKFALPLLAAAFIRYCWKCRIPLPRHGTKKIEIGPDGFIFTIEVTAEVVRRHGALPQGELARGPAAAGEASAEKSASAPEEAAAAEKIESEAEETPAVSMPSAVEEAPAERVASAS